MPDLYIFKTQVGMFDPVALQDHYVAIHYIQSIYYRKVNFIEAIPPFQCANLGAVAAGAVTARTNIVNLEMADNEFGLFRWWVVDDVQIRLYHPAGIAKAQLRNLQAPYDMNTVNRDPNLVSSEIAVWEDNRPAMEAINGSALAVGGSRIIAIGYRFHTEDMEDRDDKKKMAIVESLKAGLAPCTHVWCSGRGIGD